MRRKSDLFAFTDLTCEGTWAVVNCKLPVSGSMPMSRIICRPCKPYRGDKIAEYQDAPLQNLAWMDCVVLFGLSIFGYPSRVPSGGVCVHSLHSGFYFQYANCKAKEITILSARGTLLGWASAAEAWRVWPEFACFFGEKAPMTGSRSFHRAKQCAFANLATEV